MRVPEEYQISERTKKIAAENAEHYSTETAALVLAAHLAGENATSVTYIAYVAAMEAMCTFVISMEAWGMKPHVAAEKLIADLLKKYPTPQNERN